MDAILIMAWNALVKVFLPLFTPPTARVSARLLTGWILCTGRHTVTGMIRGADPGGGRAHDAYHRLFRYAAWNLSELWRRLAVLLIQRFYPHDIIRIDLDDTLFHRPERRFWACADGFYATLAGRKIAGGSIISRIRRDAVLYELPPQRARKTRGRPRQRGQKLAASQRLARHLRHKRQVITDERGQKRTRLVYARPVLWYRVSKEPTLKLRKFTENELNIAPSPLRRSHRPGRPRLAGNR